MVSYGWLHFRVQIWHFKIGDGSSFWPLSNSLKHTEAIVVCDEQSLMHKIYGDSNLQHLKPGTAWVKE